MIGNQTWLAENLNYEAEGGKYYNNDPANGQKYGRLYNWEVAKKACPPSWHLPSDAEWTKLTDFVGTNAGTKLKAMNGWNGKDNGTDDFGFSALPGGSGYSDGSFYDVSYYGIWWSATESSAGSAYRRVMGYDLENVNRDSRSKGSNFLLSVRCVQD